MDNKEFSRILPCYFGQKVQHENGEIGTIDEIDKKDNGELLVVCYDTVQAYFNQGQFKLILRKMEDMTEEEWSELSSIISKGETSDWRCAASFKAGFKFNNERISLKSFNDITKPINYLRSIGVDVDGILDHPEFGIREKDLPK